MTRGPDLSSLSNRLEAGRRVGGFLLEVGVKAYGAGAVASAALSDSETVGGKIHDAVAAVPNLMERYRAAKYVVDHRVEIQDALDYINLHTPPQAELENAAHRGTETLQGIDATYSEIDAAKQAVEDIDGIGDFDKVGQAIDHVRAAWGSKPDLDSIRDLADTAEQVNPLVDHVQVLIPVYYGGLLDVVDNFASDERAGTLGVMAAAFVVALVLGRAVGFWTRRGRPGWIARTLQRWGARVFRPWYVHNLPLALSPPLYAAARERIQHDIVEDLHDALDPEALRELELYFERKLREDLLDDPGREGSGR